MWTKKKGKNSQFFGEMTIKASPPIYIIFIFSNLFLFLLGILFTHVERFSVSRMLSLLLVDMLFLIITHLYFIWISENEQKNNKISAHPILKFSGKKLSTETDIVRSLNNLYMVNIWAT